MNVLILNPYSSPAYLSEQFNKLGISTIGVYTTTIDMMVEYVRPDPSWFTKQIFISAPSIDEILKALNGIKIDYVINGYELSVELSDQITQILTPDFTNNPKTSKWRSDKFLMHQELARNNLRHIGQIELNLLTDNIIEISRQIKFPCFVKPLLGTSSYYAKKISSSDEFIKYFTQLNKQEYLFKLMLPDLISSFNFLVGEFIEGDEFVVDTFSMCKTHYLSCVYQNVKKSINGIPFYRYTEMIKNPQITNTLNNYVRQCLSVLEFDNGFAHTELLLNQNYDDPCLIEVNPRISGCKGMLNYITTLSGMTSQVDLLVNHVLQLIPKPPLPKFLYYRMLYIFNFSLNPLPDLAKSLIKFKTIKEIKYLKSIGSLNHQVLSPLSDAVAFIICAANSIEELVLESEEILYLDENGLL